MRERIIHPSESGLSVIVPCDCGLPVAEIARKDVPAGVPYLIIDASDIPADRTYRAAWTANFSQPDGYGIGAEAWFAEQEQANANHSN
jgi:hypothetical protein